MKKYLVCLFERFYPKGGHNDIGGIYTSKSEALKIARDFCLKDEDNQASVTDLETMRDIFVFNTLEEFYTPTGTEEKEILYVKTKLDDKIIRKTLEKLEEYSFIPASNTEKKETTVKTIKWKKK